LASPASTISKAAPANQGFVKGAAARKKCYKILLASKPQPGRRLAARKIAHANPNQKETFMTETTKAMDGKSLYFEMRTHAPDRSAIFRTQGMTKMSAIGNCIDISWPDFPGSKSFKSVTLRPGNVANIEVNKEGRKFKLFDQELTPDFIYIEHS
jgi:hypothetical protein